MKTGCVFSLSFFPQMYLMERIRRSDVILILSDVVASARNPINRCSIRSAGGAIEALTIPVNWKHELPADKCIVHGYSDWRREIVGTVRRAFYGLQYRDEAMNLVDTCVRRKSPNAKKEYLVDVLMSSFVIMLDEMGWEKTVLRGDTLQRRRYSTDSEFLLNLALEGGIDSLIVGHRQKHSLNQRLFRRNGVDLSTQFWEPPPHASMVDSLLDSVARVGIQQTKEML